MLRLLVAALVGASLPVVPVAIASAEPAVEFPTAWRVNPDVRAYTVRVTDPDPVGRYVLRASGGDVDFSPDGTADAVFAADGYQVVSVVHCAPGETLPCTPVATSQPLAVYRDVAAKGAGGQFFGPNASGPFRLDMAPQVTVDLTWTVRDPADGRLVTSGTLAGHAIHTGAALDLDLPPETPSGQYELRVHAATPTPDVDYGALDTELGPFVVRWDRDADEGVLRLSASTYYPADDGYRDDVLVKATVPNARYVADVDVLGPDGRVLQSFYPGNPNVSEKVDVPAGRTTRTLTVRLTTTDPSGNVAVTTAPLVARAERIHLDRFRRTYPAASTIQRRSAGACGKVAVPAAGGPRGSVGLYSTLPCSRRQETVVSVVGSVAVPVAFRGHYKDLTLTFRGGKARGTRRAYLVVYQWNAERGRYDHRKELRGKRGAYPVRAAGVPARQLVFRSGRPRIAWNLGLQDGSRYDVDAVTVDLTYSVLR